MSTQPSRPAVLAVRAVKAAATTAVAGTAVVLTLGAALASTADEASNHSDTAAGRVGQDSRCTGAHDQAIVRSPDGRIRVVSFEQGWKVYRGERPGTLVVVCPD